VPIRDVCIEILDDADVACGARAVFVARYAQEIDLVRDRQLPDQVGEKDDTAL
jgi:hypothetical protein